MQCHSVSCGDITQTGLVLHLAPVGLPLLAANFSVSAWAVLPLKVGSGAEWLNARALEPDLLGSQPSFVQSAM